VVGLLLAVVLCLVCLGISGIYFVESILCIRDARYPTKVVKIVHASKVDGASGKWGGKIYARMIDYDYSVGSQFYRGEAFPSASTEEALSNLTVGQTVSIGYNPNNPDYSFLAPVSFPWPGLALGTIFGSAGVWGSYRISKQLRKRKQ